MSMSSSDEKSSNTLPVSAEDASDTKPLPKNQISLNQEATNFMLMII